jgi:hypothetical protein
MSARLRIESIVLKTDNGDVRHNFAGPLTVLSGPIGVGKTSLLELIKFAFGGRGRISPVARDHVVAVQLLISIEGQRLRLTRSLAGDVSTIISDSDNAELSGSYSASRWDGEQEHISEMLFRALGLPAGATYSTKTRTSRITFNNLWWYVYIEQRDIDRSIAHSGETYADPARRATFDLLYGLVTSEEMTIRARAQALDAQRIEAAKHEETVKRFLRDSHSESSEVARASMSQAMDRLQQARESLARLRNESIQSQASVDVVRDMVLRERDTAAELERVLENSRVRYDTQSRLLNEFRVKAVAAERTSVATDLLAPIDFVVCPRCAQSLKGRVVAHSDCTLCLQPEPALTEVQMRRAEAAVAAASAQENEMTVVLDDLRSALVENEALLSAGKRNVLKLEQLLDERTQQFISPRLEAFADSSAEEARSVAEITALEATLRQWDIVNDLERKSLEVQWAIDSDRVRLVEIDANTSVRRGEIVDEIDSEFRRLVGRLGIPTVTSTDINPKTYLPYVNGTRWDQVSTGGIATALACAYWVSLLSVGLRYTETFYPGLMILDTPRKSIGAANAEIIGRLYTELDILAASYPDRVQVIVADNDIPASISSRWHDIGFDYDNPTVGSIVHPGEAQVSVLEASATPTDWVEVGKD